MEFSSGVLDCPYCGESPKFGPYPQMLSELRAHIENNHADEADK